MKTIKFCGNFFKNFHKNLWPEVSSTIKLFKNEVYMETLQKISHNFFIISNL